MKIRLLGDFDYILFFCVAGLVVLGITFIYSSGIITTGASVSTEYIKQIVWASTGTVLMLIVSIFDYRLLKRYVNWMFLFLVLILIYTRLFGKYVNGAKSWLGFGSFGLQPSEFCKIIYILFFAAYLEKHAGEPPKRCFIKSMFIMFVPVLLILSQPDLGTASVYIPIFIVMCFVAGLPFHYIMIVLLTGILTVVFTVLPVWQSDIAKKTYPVISLLTNIHIRLFVIIGASLVVIISLVGAMFFPNNKYYYWAAYIMGVFVASLIFSYGSGKVLKDYQLKRLIIYLDPQSDPLGAGWNIIQSKIAIGAGGIMGRGFLNGTQSHYRFLPQQSTDFIFSILSEELGFFGGLAVFFLYFIIFIRTMLIMRATKNVYGYYIAAGILAMLFFHFAVNVGMVMGMMPITGIPLLFLSYGGSSLWTAMSSVGLLISINYRKKELEN